MGFVWKIPWGGTLVGILLFIWRNEKVHAMCDKFTTISRYYALVTGRYRRGTNDGFIVSGISMIYWASVGYFPGEKWFVLELHRTWSLLYQGTLREPIGLSSQIWSSQRVSLAEVIDQFHTHHGNLRTSYSDPTDTLSTVWSTDAILN